MDVQVSEQRSNLALAHALVDWEAHIQSQLNGRVYDFQMLVRGGGLVLRGRCRTYYAKQIAQHTVMKTTRLPIVANEIVVSARH
jgi:osmotically-inducible protein OsmY